MVALVSDEDEEVVELVVELDSLVLDSLVVDSVVAESSVVDEVSVEAVVDESAVSISSSPPPTTSTISNATMTSTAATMRPIITLIVRVAGSLGVDGSRRSGAVIGEA